MLSFYLRYRQLSCDFLINDLISLVDQILAPSLVLLENLDNLSEIMMLSNSPSLPFGNTSGHWSVVSIETSVKVGLLSKSLTAQVDRISVAKVHIIPRDIGLLLALVHTEIQ